jgi:hypothetical protein
MNTSKSIQRPISNDPRLSQSTNKPNEQAGFHFSSSIKITDPNSGEVLVQMRAD